MISLKTSFKDMSLMKRLLPFLLLLITSQLFSQIFVDQNATGNNDGTSWEDAFTSLHVAIAQANGEIWITSGIYKPALTDRDSSFFIGANTSLYGGFTGSEISKAERLPNHRTILDGDIGILNDSSDNSYNVLSIPQTYNVHLDGLIIRNANADGTFAYQKVGGAIHCEASYLTLNNCILENNNADSLAAGIFYKPFVGGELKLVKTTFNNNAANGAEGIYLNTKNSILSIDESTFGNHLKGSSIIKIDSGNAKISNTNFFNNKNKYNGCIYIEGNGENSVAVKGCEYFNNKGFTSSFLYTYLVNVSIDSSHFYNNEIRGSGNFNVYADTLSLINSVFENNSAKYCFGPYATTDVCIIDNVKFLNNNSEMGYGCGYLNCKDVRISNSLIENISSESSIAGFSISSDNFILKKSTFKHLSASSNASMQIDVEGSAFIDSCFFIENSVTGQAGSFYAYVKDSLIIKNTQFKDNESTNGESGCYDVSAKEHILENCSFVNNYAKNSTATFTSSGNLRIKNCLFKQNETAFNAGAFSGWGNYAEVVNSVFEDNIASENAGAIYISSDSIVIDRCIFKNNISREGGALYSSGKTLISRSIFLNNGSQVCLRGGAVSLNLYNENSYLYGNVFKGNVSENGGAIYLFSGGVLNYKSYLINNTVVENKGVNNRSGALHFISGAGILKNNIVWNNGDSSIYIKPEAQVSYEQNIINGIISEEENIEQEPFLQDNYYPLAFSNAVDFGVSNVFHQLFPEDLYGNIRVQGNAVDLGAVETDYTSDLFTLEGKVLYDPEQTCQENESAIGLKGLLLRATPGDYYTTTNAKGEFSFRLPIGSYSITQILDEHTLEEMSPLCPTNGVKTGLEAVQVGQFIDAGAFFNQVKTCERLDVQISSLRKRNCFESNTEVLVTNKSVLPVSNRTLDVVLSDNITVKRFTPENKSLSTNGDTASFLISQLNTQESYRVIIEDSVNCDPLAENLNEFVCVKAVTESQDNCTQVSPAWDGSDIGLLGTCIEGGAFFYLVNNSTSSMSSEEEYRIFINDTLVFEGKYKLSPNDTAKITIYDSFDAIRFEADQTEGNPFNSVLYFGLGACNTNNIGEFMPIMYNANKVYGKAENCIQITGSYDPNEIIVSPTGWGEDGNILKDQPLEYTIHFQNTGTDTASRVIIIDTLTQYYDMSTFKELPSSHKAELHLFGKNPTVAVWTLKNISLPDSATDFKGSQGYVSFSINLESTISEGTKVENTADIYFDYNNPIKTNTVLNTIHSDYPERLGEVVVEEEVVLASDAVNINEKITVGPNPFRQNIYINGIQEEANLMLFSAFGEIVLDRSVLNGEEVVIPKNITGVVIYELQSKDRQVIKRGKLVSY